MIDSYAKLPLGMYLEIRALQEDEAIDATDLRVKVVALLTGRTEREVLHAPIAESSEWFAAATFLEREAPPAPRIADVYEVGPFQLVPTRDLRKVITAQYIDFQGFAPGGEKQLPELLSVFLVPRGCVYGEDYDVAEVQQAIREALPVADVLALTAFFLRKYAALIRTSRSYLATMQRRERNPRKRELIRARMARMEALVAILSRTAGAGSPASTA